MGGEDEEGAPLLPGCVIWCLWVPLSCTSEVGEDHQCYREGCWGEGDA